MNDVQVLRIDSVGRLAGTLLCLSVAASGCPGPGGPETTASGLTGDGLGAGDTVVEVSGPGDPTLRPPEKESPPAPGPVRTAKFPPITSAPLKNGLDLVILEDHSLPVVSLQVVFGSGSAADPAGATGVADFAAEMLRKGTTRRSADEIAETIEFVGGSLGISTGQDATTIQVDVLSTHLDTAVDLLADILLNPTFPEGELRKLREKSIAELKDLLSKPSFLASRALAAALYGDHPYARISPTEASLSSIKRAHLVKFHKTHMVAANAFMVVAGDVKPAAIRAKLDNALKLMRKGKAARAIKAAPSSSGARTLHLVHRPDSAQTEIYLGRLAINRADPDYLALSVANHVLGGSASARLFYELRKEKKYTYGAYSAVRARGAGGHWYGLVRGVDVPKSIPAVRDFLDVVERLDSDPLDDDLRAAKSYLVGSFPTTIETITQVASKVVEMKLYGLADDYWETYGARIDALDADTVRAAAARHIRAEEGVLVIVGDAEAKVPVTAGGAADISLKEALRELGDVEVFSIEGKKLETLKKK